MRLWIVESSLFGLVTMVVQLSWSRSSLRCGRIERDGLARDRDQLRAEALARVQAGAIWWLEDPALIAAANAVQEAR